VDTNYNIIPVFFFILYQQKSHVSFSVFFFILSNKTKYEKLKRLYSSIIAMWFNYKLLIRKIEHDENYGNQWSYWSSSGRVVWFNILEAMFTVHAQESFWTLRRGRLWSTINYLHYDADIWGWKQARFHGNGAFTFFKIKQSVFPASYWKRVNNFLVFSEF